MMHEKGSCQCGEMEGMFDFSMIPMEMKKELKMAYLKKKEKVLEAKLEFIREINRIIKKSSGTSAAKEE